MILLDNEVTLRENADGLFLEHSQAITSEMLDTLKSERFAKAHLRAADYDRVFSIPTQVVEIWARQGFDIHKASLREVLARLRKEDLDHFITTPKRV